MAVRRNHGKAVWHQVEFPALYQRHSTGTFEVSRSDAACWMRAIPTVRMAWVNYFGGLDVQSTSALSTGTVQAELLMERSEPTAEPGARIRYYRYLFARVADGRWFQAGPDKALRCGLEHHEYQRPIWVDELHRCSSSTGW